MAAHIVLSVKTAAAIKSVVWSWLVTGISAFAIVEKNYSDASYAAMWGFISALGAAFIAGTVKVCVTMINTSRGRREQRLTEFTADQTRWHKFYAEKLAWKDEQFYIESNILRIVRNSKHHLISDIGARDHYIDQLEDVLRAHHVEFERVQFRNLAEAFKDEDDNIRNLIENNRGAPPPAK